MTFDVEISQTLHDELARLDAALVPREPMYRAVGEYLRDDLQEHFRGLAATNRNPYGFSGVFWDEQRAGTFSDADNEGATLSFPRPVAQRAFGGTITPGPGKQWLTIPARQEAYRQKATVFDDLRFIPLGPERAMLVRNLPSTVTATRDVKGKLVQVKETGSEVMYWLRKSVTQFPDDSILPTREHWIEVATEAVTDFLDLSIELALSS